MQATFLYKVGLGDRVLSNQGQYPSSGASTNGEALERAISETGTFISLDHVSKTFVTPKGEVDAVRDVSLHVKKGEIFGIIGFSGAGKSTLVRCINLLERPTSGRVVIGGKDLTALGPKELREVRKRIGMIFQHFNLMASRTVFENVLLPLKLSTLTRDEQKHKVEELLDLVGLTDKRDVYPSQLSGGQKQRVAIARALANDPEVLLCDEATSALDPQTTRSILNLLLEVNKKLGLTMIVITHQMSVVKTLCDRVAVMENGQIRECNDVIEIFSDPQAQITKNFIKTTDNLETFYEKLREGSLPGIGRSTPLWFLTFDDQAVQRSCVSNLTEKFGLKSNIIYANVDFLKGRVLGKLAIGLKGEEQLLNEGYQWLIDQGIRVEVLQ